MKNFIHRQGVHCETSALRDIFEFYGYRFTEPMLFGLGSGLGFIYWKMKQMPYPFVGGRTKDLLQNICSNLNIKITKHQTNSSRKGWEEVKALIDSDNPVLLYADMYYLDYFGKRVHFGQHAIVLADYDEKYAYLADNNFGQLQRTTIKTLETARNSNFKPFPPKNTFFTFKFPKKLPLLKGVIHKAINNNANVLLNPPINNLGIKGILKFSDEILKLSKEECKMVYIYLEKAGTGGGNFRNLYSQFLIEANAYLQNEKIAKAGKMYKEIAQDWTKIAEEIREYSDLQGTSRKIKALAEKEQQAMKFLSEI